MNVLPKRMNKTLVEKVRWLLNEAKLPGILLAEALNIAAYVINLSPIITLDNDILDKVWFGSDVFYYHFASF